MTRKKGVELKTNLIQEVQKCVEEYASMYLFGYNDLKTSKIHEIREAWPRSRFLFGKNSLMSIAFGKSEKTEFKKNLHELTSFLSGPHALFFTNEAKEDVLKWFDKLQQDEEVKLQALWTNNGLIEKFPLANNVNDDISPNK